jgi:HlyD family secretion protein
LAEPGGHEGVKTVGQTGFWGKRKSIYTVTGVVLATFLLLGLAACSSGKAAGTTSLVEVTRGDLTVNVSGSGNLAISRDAKLFFEDGGKIDKINVKEGDRVKQGDVLAHLVPLNPDLLEQAVQNARSNLASAAIGVTLAQNNYDIQMAQDPYNASALERAVANAQATLESLGSDLRNADINLETANNNYNKLFVSDPFRTYKFSLPEYADALGQTLRSLDQIQADIGSGKVNSDTLKNEVADARQQVADIQQKLLYGLGEGSRPAEINYWTLRAAQLQIDAAQAARDKVVVAQQQAQLSLDKASEDLRKTQELNDKTVIGLKLDIEKSRLTQQQAQLSLDQAQNNLKDTSLVAPWGGQVAVVYVSEGDIVSAAGAVTKTIIYLVDPSSLEFNAKLDEVDIARIQLGQKVDLKVDAVPDNRYTGTVKSIGLTPNNESGLISYPVKVSLDAPDSPELKSGMSATVDIVTEERSGAVLLLSRLIVHDAQGNHTVTVSVNGQTETRTVTVGATDGYKTEILSGLAPGDQAVDKRAAATTTNGIF